MKEQKILKEKEGQIKKVREKSLSAKPATLFFIGTENTFSPKVCRN